MDRSRSLSLSRYTARRNAVGASDEQNALMDVSVFRFSVIVAGIVTYALWNG